MGTPPPIHAIRRGADLLRLVLRYPNRLDAFFRAELDRLWRPLSSAARLYRRCVIPRKRLVAVVGSVGKSTAVRVLRAGLLEEDRYQSFSNYGTRLAENLLRSRPWDPYDVFEVGIAAPGQMRSYAEMIRPDVVVVTAIGSDHNRSFPTLEDTRREKLEMARALRPGGVLVLNGDDPHVLWMASQTEARVVTFGRSPACDVRASELEVRWPTGSTFLLHTPEGARRVKTKLIGWTMMYSILAAIAVAVAEGIPLGRMLARLEALPPTRGRMEPVVLDGGITLLDDSFKGQLESCEAALDVFAGLPAKRRIVVLGGIEEPQGAQRPLYVSLGRRIAACADLLLFVPRGSSFARIRSGAVRGGMPREAVLHASSSIEKAYELLAAELREGDVVLLKGPYASRLRRIVLRLQGRNVRCTVKGCQVKVFHCEECPLVERDAAAIDNVFIARLLRT